MDEDNGASHKAKAGAFKTGKRIGLPGCLLPQRQRSRKRASCFRLSPVVNLLPETCMDVALCNVKPT
jgi:hypothetical protein